MEVEKEMAVNSYKLPSLQELLEAGVHFGHQVRRGDPRMNQYIYGIRGGVHIINLESSEKKLQEAAEFLFELGKSGKSLLYIGTKKQAKELVKEVALKTNSSYVDFKWRGGLLTNFEEVKKNIKKLLELRDLKEKGELNKYTKKEQLLIHRKLEKFDESWGGVALMENLPDALFVVDSVNEKTALHEAIRLGIPVVGITDTNSNPFLVTYPIPANDDATKALKLIIETMSAVYQAGLKEWESAKGKVESQKTDTEKKAGKSEDPVVGSDSIGVDGAILAEVAVAEEAVEKAVVEENKRES